MRMENQQLAPCVQCGDEPGGSAHVLGIGEKLPQRITCTVEQDVAHEANVEQPERIELFGNGEDDVDVLAVKKTRLCVAKPLLNLDEGALRTRPMPA